MPILYYDIVYHGRHYTIPTIIPFTYTHSNSSLSILHSNISNIHLRITAPLPKGQSTLHQLVGLSPCISPGTHPREPRKLLLIRRAQLRMHRCQRRLFPRELLIEIARVGRISDGREVWWCDPAMVDVVKGDVFEEEVFLDLLGVGLACSESSGGVASQQLGRVSISVTRNSGLTRCRRDTASRGMVIGYKGSSSRIASKISSSSSPRKGDCPSNIS